MGQNAIDQDLIYLIYRYKTPKLSSDEIIQHPFLYLVLTSLILDHSWNTPLRTSAGSIEPAITLQLQGSMACPLTALANIISTEVDVITKAYSQKDLQFPSLNDPLQPSPLDVDPSLAKHKALIAAAAAQILAMVRPPFETFLELSSGMYGTGTAAFVVDTNIPDILKEAGAAVCLWHSSPSDLTI